MANLVDNMGLPESAITFRAGAASLEMSDDHYAAVPSTSGMSSTGTQAQKRNSASGQDNDGSYVSFSMPGPSGFETIQPDSPEVDIHMTHNQELQSVYQIYHASMATEETVKCIVTSVLFFAIIALVLVIAFTQNPMMS